MSGTSMGHSQCRSCSGNKTLKRCNKYGEADNVILIDVDNDNIDNVIIIDVPDTLPKKVRHSHTLKEDKGYPLRNIIFIDDDEVNANNHLNDGIKTGNTFFNEESSSVRFCSASDNSSNSSHEFNGDCQFVQANISPVKISKCKRTYSGKASTRNRYGLTSDSESSSSDDDPDFELEEDSFGKLKAQWEKASLKRKNDIRAAQPHTRYYHGASAVFNNGDRAEKNSGPREETPICSSSGKSIDEEASTPIDASQDGHMNNTHGPETATFVNTTPVMKTHLPNGKADIHEKDDPLTEDPPFQSGDLRKSKNFGHSDPDSNNGREHHTQGSPFSPFHKSGRDHGNHKRKHFQKKDQSSESEPCLSKSRTSNNESSCEETSCSMEDACKYQHHPGADTGNSTFRHKDQEYSFEHTKSRHEYGNHGVATSSNEIGPHLEDNCFKKTSWYRSRINAKKNCQENIETASEELSQHSDQSNEAESRQWCPGFAETSEDILKFPSSHHVNEDAQITSEDGDTMEVENCVIGEREKFKETDEYKRALEEELASRQRVLQIQAQEAQRLRLLRKRRKAESIRLLEMERRQKQRVEEIRETQKKDEENMNLKEVIRGEVRKELQKLEITSHDMASLLRGLGILVHGGLHPLSHEVRAAYKRAVLAFHPDRASGSDIRQLVEAEEKFKLISRMKDKLLATF